MPEALREAAARRGFGLLAALVLEALLILLVLTLGMGRDVPEFAGEKVASFDVSEASDQDKPQEQPAAQPPAAAPQASPDAPRPAQDAAPSALPVVQQMPPPAAVIPVQPAPSAAPAAPRARAVVKGQAFGPADTGRPGPPDSQRVGTAPNGQPLYAAAWYREPYADELRGYLSAARGPGWGLIACRTAPDWRVEDCQELGESPQGSGIAHAAAAAAWQFKVRPPRIGGAYKVGEWVRIRIDYDTRPPNDPMQGQRRN